MKFVMFVAIKTVLVVLLVSGCASTGTIEERKQRAVEACGLASAYDVPTKAQQACVEKRVSRICKRSEMIEVTGTRIPRCPGEVSITRWSQGIQGRWHSGEQGTYLFLQGQNVPYQWDPVLDEKGNPLVPSHTLE